MPTVPLLPNARLASASWVVLGTALFILLAWQIYHQGPLSKLDQSVAVWTHAYLTRSMTAVMLLVTHLHNTLSILIMSVITALALWLRKEWHAPGFLVFTVGGGMLINVGLKLIFARARPAFVDPLVTLDSYSFPSGHAAGSTLFYGALILLLANQERMRRPAWGFGAVMVVLVCMSRVYLGAHYLSDVLAGVTIGLVWISIGRLALPLRFLPSNAA